MKHKTFILIQSLALATAMAPAQANPVAITLGKTYSGSAATCPGDASPIASYTFDLTQNATPHLSFVGTSEGHAEAADTAPGATGKVWKASYRVHVMGESKDLDVTGENANIDLTPAAGETSMQFDVYAYNCSVDYKPTYQIRVEPTTAPLADITGKITSLSGVAISGATVTAYDADGIWYGSTFTDSKGNYDLQVDPALYFVEYSNGKVTTWAGAPRSKATAVNTIASSVVKNVTLANALPAISSITGNYAASLPITINGSGFGNTVGYLDFGGNLQNSTTTVISAWSDTAITATIPQGILPTWLRVFGKYGGWSDKYYPQGYDLPVAAPSASTIKLVKGGTFNMTVTFDKPPVVQNQQVNITWGGTAKACSTSQSSGCDYWAASTAGTPPKTISIANGQTSGTLYFYTRDLASGSGVGNKTITMTIAKGTGYKVGIPSKVTVTLIDK